MIAEEPLVQVAGQRRVTAGDGEIRLGEHQLDVAEQGAEEIPVVGHLAHGGLAVLRDDRLQPGAEAEPARQDVAALGPGEDPGHALEVLDGVVGLQVQALA